MRRISLSRLGGHEAPILFFDFVLAAFFVWTCLSFYLSQVSGLKATALLTAIGGVVAALATAHTRFWILLMVVTIPLSEVISRMVHPQLAPFSIFLSCIASLAFIVRPRLDQFRTLQEPPAIKESDRLDWVDLFVFTSIALMGVSTAIVLLRYANLYPFSGEGFVNLEVNRAGQRTLDAVVFISSTLAVAVSSLFLLRILCRRLNEELIPSIQTAIVLTVPVVGIFAFVQQRTTLLEWLRPGGIWVSTGRLNSTFTDPNALATWVVLVFPVTALGCFEGSWKRRSLCAAASLTSLYLVYVTASKTAFWGLVLEVVLVSGTFLAVGLLRRTYRAVVMGATLLTAGAALAAAALLLPQRALLAERLAPTLRFITDLMEGKDLVSSFAKLESFRVQWWPSAVRMLRESPWTGVGFGAFPFETINHGIDFFDSAGNFFLQTAAELGIPGVVLMAIATVLSIWIVLRLAANPRLLVERYGLAAYGILIGLGTLGLLLNLGCHLLFPQVAFFFVLFLAIIVTYYRNLFPVRHSASGRLRNTLTGLSLLIATAPILAGLPTLQYTEPRVFRLRELGRPQDLFGYGEEKGAGLPFRWLSGRDSAVIVTRDSRLVFEISSGYPEVASRPLEVRFMLDGVPIGDRILSDREWHRVELSVPENLRNRPVNFQVASSYTWRPSDFGSKDSRVLGVALRGFNASKLLAGSPGLPQRNP